MTAKQYLDMVTKDIDKNPSAGIFSATFCELSDAIDALTHPERIALRSELERLDCQNMLHNLYYDYDKQVWIGMTK